ncbi:MAG TPA: hypothetical protein PKC13_24240 [Blastocatellia bacterium]|nr:hypothetical protein [Blastocatellia bacterium]HMY71190.1 hypothetical protein [Blastocatellia bacterium]
MNLNPPTVTPLEEIFPELKVVPQPERPAVAQVAVRSVDSPPTCRHRVLVIGDGCYCAWGYFDPLTGWYVDGVNRTPGPYLRGWLDDPEHNAD